MTDQTLPFGPMRRTPDTRAEEGHPVVGHLPPARPAVVPDPRSRATALPREGALSSLLRLPAHLGVFMGLSAGAYALSLAGITALQSSSEAALAADRAPALAVIEAAQRDHGALEARIQSARQAYEAAAAAYAATGAGFADMEARLKDLATAMTQLNGSAATLPSGVKLPSVSRSAGAAAAPAVQATTTASGA